jgi:predicted metal-dependent hydrolase
VTPGQPHRLEQGSLVLSYTLERRRRRTVGILVDPQQGVIVRAPLKLGLHAIEEVLLAKHAWIAKHLARLQAQGLPRPPHLFQNGETFLHLGRSYALEVRPSAVAALTPPTLADGRLLVTAPAALTPELQSDLVHRAILRWYRRQAAQLLPPRVEPFAAALGLPMPRVLIRDQKTRWGSCGPDGTLRLNWRLVMAPPDIIDYLAAHEVCHLRVPAHSPAFWSLVASLVPDCKDRRARLRRDGHMLTI